MPKFNLYQSLHTTAIGPQGKALEVQIRTREMHHRAEFGVAAHWAYKDEMSPTDMQWLSRIIDWQSETADPNEFMESLKLDLEQDEVFVFSPKGKVVTLAAGSTPIDFAYAIHTEVGHACIGARVNGRLQPLDSTLQSGDSVEIFTSKVEHGPSRDWLAIAVTPRARNKIRQWFSRERREDALETGKDELARALRREGMPVQKIMSGPAIHEIAAKLSYTDVDMLLIAIGENHVSAKSVAQRIGRDLRQGDGEEQLPITARAPQRRRKPTAGVHVEGLDDVMVRLSRCCTPVPGDDIMGFVTRGRGVSVHRTDCSNAVSLSSEQGGRLIDVEWDRDHGMDTYVVSIEVRALDRARLLRDVAAVLGDHHVSVLSSASQTSADRTSRMRFDFELADPSHLDSLLASLRQVDSVYDAYRLLPGANTAS
jgi:GTP pyrophosphokinase